MRNSFKALLLTAESSTSVVDELVVVLLDSIRPQFSTVLLLIINTSKTRRRTVNSQINVKWDYFFMEDKLIKKPLLIRF